MIDCRWFALSVGVVAGLAVEPAWSQRVAAPTGAAADAPILSVYGTDVRPVIVAVPAPQAAASGAPDQAWLAAFDVRLRAAIGFHGALAPLSRDAELAAPGPIDRFDPVPWQAAGAEIVLRTSAARDGAATVVDVYVYDVATHESLLAQRFKSSAAGAEPLADAVAGAVVAKLLDVPSVFAQPIVFQYREPGQKWRELAETDWSGRAPMARTRGQKLVLNPAWLGSSERVVAIGYRTRRPALTMFDLAKGSELSLLESPTNMHGPAALPDGTHVVVAWERGGNTDLYLVDLDSGGYERLTTSSAADLSPAVSPDGRRVVFVSDRRGNPYLYLLELDTRQIKPLVLDGVYLGEPDWSPDGKRVVFVRRDRGQGTMLWSIDVDSGTLRALTGDLGDSVEGPTWAADSRTVIFSRLEGASYDLFKVDRQLGQVRRLTQFAGDARMPAWRAAPSR